MTDSYDFIVVGGGPVGETAAEYAIKNSDLSAAIVESHLLGGACSYYACTPSKALLRPLDIAETSANLGGLSPAAVHADGLLARRDEFVNNYDDSGQVEWAEGVGIDVIRGVGAVGPDRTVRVGDRTLTARRAVVVATGSSPSIPEPLQGLHPWTSRDATGLVEVPPRLAIIGGGPVACEAARWLAGLGARVTLLARSTLLGRAEPFCGELVAEGLREAGVDVRLGTELTSAERPGAQPTGLGRVHGGPVWLQVGNDEFEVDEVLAATGRNPNLAGIQLDPQPDWLHLVGDVSGEAPLTHWGKYRARQLGFKLRAEALGQPAPHQSGDVPIPQVVFTSPQVASTGYTLAQARKKWPNARAIDADLTSAAGAGLLRDDAAGQARLVVDQDEVLRGATFVGPEVAELVHAATVAIVASMQLDQLWHVVPSFPTSSEIWLRLLEADN
ncbi:MAG: dihydrolipoyl dehydrogenase family protein [Brooklawnia sp.]|jgi:pyruvate/2-oxoglutarate dehydrogenase complex dihydrolipoamide dehydrogenase (E3) component